MRWFPFSPSRDTEAAPRRPAAPGLRPLLGAIGLVVFLGAAAVALREFDPAALAEANPLRLAAIAACILANLALAGMLFWAVTRPFEASPPVGLGRMTALIAASSLLNYLPLRAGLVGRTAYLKTRHGLSLTSSGIILVIVLAVATLVSGAATTLLLAPIGPWRWPLAGLALAGGTLSRGPLARRLVGRPLPLAWTWIPLRSLDLAVTGVRLWLVFEVIGHPVPFETALVLSAAGTWVSLVGFTPNGLGLREWLLGGLAHWLDPVTGTLGLQAAVLERAVEALVVVAVGGGTLLGLSLGGGNGPGCKKTVPPDAEGEACAKMRR